MLINSNLYSEATGSIGNLTARPSRGGISLIDKITPKITTTTRKSKINQIISDAHKRWKTLTPAIRHNWNTYAEARPRTDILGNSNTISGLQEFIHSATNFELDRNFNKYYRIRPPTEIGFNPHPLVRFQERSGGGGLQVRQGTDTDDLMLFYISNPHNITSNTYRGYWKTFYELPGTFNYWQTIPNTHEVNKNYFFRVVFFSRTGRLSKPVIYKQHTAP